MPRGTPAGWWGKKRIETAHKKNIGKGYRQFIEGEIQISNKLI